MNTDVHDIDGLRFWKAFRDRYYVKEPYNWKGLMNGKNLSESILETGNGNS